MSYPKNAQLADSATGDAERTCKKKKSKAHSDPEDVVHDRSKDASRSGENCKERKAKTKKRSDAVHYDDTNGQTMEEIPSDKSKRKRKRRVEEQSKDIPSGSEFPKKRKGHHPPGLFFPDPSSDESLSDQSRKALLYAYARFQDLPNWKFNKARQIWLIKKLWSEEMIPEKYFALVIKYLADVKGMIRDNIVQMCNTIVAATNNSGRPTTQVTRACSLLDALSDVKHQNNNQLHPEHSFIDTSNSTDPMNLVHC